jgi:hypothetical protein
VGNVNTVSQGPPETLCCNLHHVSFFEPQAIAEAKAIRSKEVNMNISGTAMGFELKVMMFDVLLAMTHFRLTTAKRLAPSSFAITLDPRSHSDRGELWVNCHLRAECARAKLGARQVKIVFLFELVIGKLVSRRHPDSIRLSVGGN